MSPGFRIHSALALALVGIEVAIIVLHTSGVWQVKADDDNNHATAANAAQLVSQGRTIFRSDTFGDQAFWGDTLRLHKAIEGAALGGVGSGLSPAAALSAGLKVDVDEVASSAFGVIEPSDGGCRQSGGVTCLIPGKSLVIGRLIVRVGAWGAWRLAPPGVVLGGWNQYDSVPAP